jgi:hypothetical protein
VLWQKGRQQEGEHCPAHKPDQGRVAPAGGPSGEFGGHAARCRLACLPAVGCVGGRACPVGCRLSGWPGSWVAPLFLRQPYPAQRLPAAASRQAFARDASQTAGCRCTSKLLRLHHRTTGRVQCCLRICCLLALTKHVDISGLILSQAPI